MLRQTAFSKAISGFNDYGLFRCTKAIESGQSTLFAAMELRSVYAVEVKRICLLVS